MTSSSVVVTVSMLALATACASAPTSDAVARGRTQFSAQGCVGCHRIADVGTPIGPDLSRVGERYSREALVRWLRDPSAQHPAGHMPTLELSEDQVADLAAYLSSLR